MAMDKNMMIVSVTSGVLGLLSVLLGFAAESTRIQLSDIYLTSWGCVHPTSPAFGLAVTAAVLLLIAQIILGVFMGCCCKTGKDPSLVSQAGSKRTSAIIMMSSSWVAFAISFILFIDGANANTAGGQIDDACSTVKPGIFAAASMLSLFTVGLGIGAYFLLHNGASSGMSPGIAMGSPQYPQGAGQVQFQQQGYGYAQGAPQPGAQPGYWQEPQKPSNQTQQQNYYPPPGTTPNGYGYNTQTNM